MLREQRCWSAWYQCVPVWFWFWFGTQGAPALTCSPALTITTSSPIHCCFHPKMSQNKQQQHPQCTFFHALLGWLKKTPQNQANTFKNPHPTAGTEQNTGGSLQWFPLCSFPLGRLAGKLLHSFHPQKLLVLFPKVIFSQPIRFPECTHHSWQGNALGDWAALPAWPCQGGKWFPHRAIFSNNSDLLTRNELFLEIDFYRAHFQKGWNHDLFTQNSPLGLLQVRPSGLRQRLLVFTGPWCCCCDLNMKKPQNLYPNVPHFWSCLTSSDLF